MKKKNTVIVAVYLFLALAILSCQSVKNKPLVGAFKAIADVATVYGNKDSHVVVINTQGGPITTLADDVLNDFIADSQSQSALFVNVHQAQTKRPDLFKKTDLTFEQAKRYDKQSVATLKRVIDFFRQQKGKTLNVLGVSFGAFMVQDLIATYGIDVADKYLIVVGRLNIDEATWQPFSQGKYTQYFYNDRGEYKIKVMGGAMSVEDKNMSRLAAGLGYHRYMTALAGIKDLSKITYVYGDRDEQVGPLSAKERQFLRNRKARVVLSKGGNHDAAINTSLALLKETFAIESIKKTRGK